MKATKTSIVLAVIVTSSVLSHSSFARGVPAFFQGRQAADSAASAKPWLPASLLPVSTYSLDDATTELDVGFGNTLQNFEAIWFNQFSVIPGETTVTGLEIAWGNPRTSDPVDGIPVTLGL